MSVYGRWHRFIKGAVVNGADPNRWIDINRSLGLAFKIQTRVRPLQSWQFENSTDGRDGVIPENQKPDGPGSPKIVRILEHSI